MIDYKIFDKADLEQYSQNELIIISVLFNAEIIQHDNNYYFVYNNNVYFVYDKVEKQLLYDSKILYDLEINHNSNSGEVDTIIEMIFEYKLNLPINEIRYNRDGIKLKFMLKNDNIF